MPLGQLSKEMRLKLQRKAKREAAAQAKLDAQLKAEVAELQVSAEIAQDGENFALEELGGAQQFERLDEVGKTEWLTSRMTEANVLSRRQLIKQIAKAYAMYALLQGNEAVRSAILNAAKLRGRELDGRTSALRLVVEQYISYGDGENNGNDKRNEDEERAKNNYSRDVAAIKHLIARDIKPSTVCALAEEKGEGLNSWSRNTESLNKQEERQPKAKGGQQYQAELFKDYSTIIHIYKEKNGKLLSISEIYRFQPTQNILIKRLIRKGIFIKTDTRRKVTKA